MQDQDLLEKLVQGHSKTLTEIQQKKSPSESFLVEIESAEQALKEARTDTEVRDQQARLKILNQNLDEVRKDSIQEEKDLAEAVLSLNAIIEGMGQEYESMTKPNEADLAPVRKAEARLEKAKEVRQEADNSWLFKASKIEAAEQEISAAETDLKNAHAQAKRAARQRLLSANFEASLQDFQSKVQKTIEIMEDRMKQVDIQVDSVKTRLEQSSKILETAATAHQQLESKLNSLESDLQVEEEQLPALQNGSPEYATQEAKVRELRHEVEEVRGRLNTALVLHQSKEKFLAELEVHLKAQVKLRDNQNMWITALRSDTEERMVTFKSRLEAMKAMSDQSIAKDLDSLGQEIDIKNTEKMAAIGAAADRLRMDKIERHPDNVARIAKIQAAQAESIHQIRMRESKALEAFKEKYGIDPTQSSFFTYAKDEEVLAEA